MYKYPMLFPLNMNHCFGGSFDGNVRQIVQCIGAKTRSFVVTQRLKACNMKGAEQGRMQQPEQENRGSNCHPPQGKFSRSGLTLSSLFNRHWEWCYPIFMDTFYARQPDTSPALHIPDPQQHTKFVSRHPSRHLAGCKDTKKVCTVLQRCRRCHITHGGPGNFEAAGVCPSVAPFSLISPKKLGQSYH